MKRTPLKIYLPGQYFKKSIGYYIRKAKRKKSVPMSNQSDNIVYTFPKDVRFPMEFIFRKNY